MPDDTSVTSTVEPASGPTSAVEPQPPADSDATPSPQPTLEDLQAELARLRANVSGTTKEWQREREQRERAQMDLARLQGQLQANQQPAAPLRQGRTVGEIARELNRAMLNADDVAAERLVAEIEERGIERSHKRVMGEIAQYSLEAQRQQSLGSYLTREGVTDSKSPLYQKTQERVRQMREDPSYLFAAGNEPVLVALAVAEVKAGLAAEGHQAAEAGRQMSSQSAGQIGSKPTGLAPGKSAAPVEKIYLREDERKAVRMMQSALGLSEAEAEKRYWARLDPSIREARTMAKKAI